MLSFHPPGQLPRNRAYGTIPHAGPLPLPQRDVSKVVWFDPTAFFPSPTMSLLSTSLPSHLALLLCYS
jgi:hypothetical protein